MGWGKEWPSNSQVWIDQVNKAFDAEFPEITSLDLATGEKVVLTTIKDGIITHTDITKEYKNKVPTHDPYSNPDSHIYYECACGAILDPGTRSFAQLNNAAMNSGWKVRWGATSYQPYCVKCGHDVD